MSYGLAYSGTQWRKTYKAIVSTSDDVVSGSADGFDVDVR